MRIAVLLACAIAAGCADDPAGPADGSARDSGGFERLDECCGLIEQTGCDVAERCTLRGAAEDPATATCACAPIGQLDRGDPCTVDDAGLDACGAGLVCFSFGGASHACAELCYTSPSDTCSQGVCTNYGGLLSSYMGLCAPAD